MTNKLYFGFITPVCLSAKDIAILEIAAKASGHDSMINLIEKIISDAAIVFARRMMENSYYFKRCKCEGQCDCLPHVLTEKTDYEVGNIAQGIFGVDIDELLNGL